MEFKLNANEQANATLFMLEHKSHGQIQYIFTPIGIGMNVKVKCIGCSEEKDITDYTQW